MNINLTDQETVQKVAVAIVGAVIGAWYDYRHWRKSYPDKRYDIVPALFRIWIAVGAAVGLDTAARGVAS